MKRTGFKRGKSQMKRSSFKSKGFKTKQPKRTPIKRVGKNGTANIKSRKDISEQCEALNLNYCEIRLEGCLGNMYLAPAHRHKRAWYKGDWKLLAAYVQWVVSCVVCHDLTEHHRELTEEIFIKLRGEE